MITEYIKMQPDLNQTPKTPTETFHDFCFSHLGSLAHNNPLQHQRGLTGPHPIQHIREVTDVPDLTRNGERLHRTPLAPGNVLQGHVDVAEARLARPTQKGRQHRRRPSPSGQTVNHRHVPLVGLEPRLHAQEQLEQQSQRGGRTAGELVHQDLIVQDVRVVLHLAEIPNHVAAAVPLPQQVPHGGQLPLGGDVPVGGGLQEGVGQRDDAVGDVDDLGVAEGLDVEREGDVALVGAAGVGEEAGRGGLEADLLLFEGFAGGFDEFVGGGHDGAGPVAEGAEHGGRGLRGLIGGGGRRGLRGRLGGQRGEGVGPPRSEGRGGGIGNFGRRRRQLDDGAAVGDRFGRRRRRRRRRIGTRLLLLLLLLLLLFVLPFRVSRRLLR
mmetsp:Transcript_20497/g.42334  ORF Transcript_20497/g.42334 Transcript_20497/m.42334 type:complete len:381 (-) Transcript_20497:122-1264(-)